MESEQKNIYFQMLFVAFMGNESLQGQALLNTSGISPGKFELFSLKV